MNAGLLYHKVVGLNLRDTIYTLN